MATRYFYIKNGFGTRVTGGGLSSQQTGSFASLGAGNVYNSCADVLADSAPPVAGDYILISDASTESLTTSTSYTFADYVFVRSVSDSACNTYSSGATLTITGSNLVLTWNGGIDTAGIIFQTTGVSIAVSLKFGQQNNSRNQRFRDCQLQLLSTGTSSGIIFSNPGVATSGLEFMLENCGILLSANGQQISCGDALVRIHGGGFLSGTATLNTGNGPFNTTAARGGYFEIIGFDCTELGSSSKLIHSSGGEATFYLSGIAFPSGWSGSLTDGTMTSARRAEMYNFSVGTNSYRLWIEDYQGSIKDDQTHYLTGGVGDGVVSNYSWVMTTNSNASPAYGGLRTPNILKLYESTGAVTPNIELLTDGQLTDKDVELHSFLLTTANSQLLAQFSTIPELLTDASNLPAGAGTGAWSSTSGLTTPISSKISDSQTIATEGIAIFRISLTAPSTTIYLNPGLT